MAMHLNFELVMSNMFLTSLFRIKTSKLPWLNLHNPNFVKLYFSFMIWLYFLKNGRQGLPLLGE